MQSRYIYKPCNIPCGFPLSSDVGNAFPGQFQYENLVVQDYGADRGISRVFGRAETFMTKVAKDSESSLLVHCRHGRNRSVTVCIALFMMYYGWSLKEALCFVSRKRPNSQIFSANRAELVNFEKRLFDVTDSSMSVQDFAFVGKLSSEKNGKVLVLKSSLC